jgi:tRNA pseudouridine13 synthase
MYRIKQQPEDFIVREIPAVTPRNAGNYLYFKLIKKGKNTIDVVRHLAKVLHIKEKHIGFAGSKDRHAITEQVISIRGVKKEHVDTVTIDDVTLEFLGYGDDPISLGDLKGNQFTIVVRNLDRVNIEPVPFVENYFDEQRFGDYNITIGKALITKNFTDAVRFAIRTGQCEELRAYTKEHPHDMVGALRILPIRLLRMYVNAYQSWLWNETVATYLKEKGTIIKEVTYRHGSFLFTAHPEQMETIEVPLVGFGTRVEDDTMRAIITALLHAETITPQDFIIREIPQLSLEGGMRKVVMNVDNFTVVETGDDELHAGKRKVVLSFTLPKGSYATMVVRRLFHPGTQ